MAPPATQSPRLAALDGIRGLAALSILVLHCWLYTTTTAQKSDSVLDGALHQLRLGVPLFFCMSGFLLYGPWVRAVLAAGPVPQLGTYVRSRARRVLPAYLVCLAGSLTLLTQLHDVRGVDVPTPDLWWLFALFANNLHPDATGALNPPMWTLAVEVQFYVLLPGLGLAALALKASGRAGLFALAFGLIAAGIAFSAWALTQPSSVVIADSLPVAAPAFGCGAMAAVASHGRRLAPTSAMVLLIAGAGLVVSDGLWHELGAGQAGRLWRDLPASAGFAMIVLAVVHGRAAWLGSRAFVALGAMSFGVYLWHMPVMFAARAAGVFPEGEPLRAVAVVTALTLPVAWASWVCLERPILQRRGSKRPHPRALVRIGQRPVATRRGTAGTALPPLVRMRTPEEAPQTR